MLLQEKIVLGIDPGTRVMGYGICMKSGQTLKAMDLGVWRLESVGDHYQRLEKIYRNLLQLIDQFLPDELAIESPFYGKDPQSMIKLGRAQGMAIAAAISRQIPVFEYAPKKVKAVVAGNGNADKHQVASMLTHYCPEIASLKAPLDATDALAVAVCHLFSGQQIKTSQPGSSWEAFIKKEPWRQVDPNR